MMDESYGKIWDKKREQEQKPAPGSSDSCILLTHKAWMGTPRCVVGFVHVHSSHVQSSSAELKLCV